MTRRAYLCALSALTLGGCGSGEKHYKMDGEVMALDAVTKNATIKHGKIEGWMDAMTMEYTVKPDAEFAKLHVGDRIQATVVVQDPVYWVTDVKVVGPAAKEELGRQPLRRREETFCLLGLESVSVPIAQPDLDPRALQWLGEILQVRTAVVIRIHDSGVEGLNGIGRGARRHRVG